MSIIIHFAGPFNLHDPIPTVIGSDESDVEPRYHHGMHSAHGVV